MHLYLFYILTQKHIFVQQGRINLSGQSVHRFGGASTLFTVKTDKFVSRGSFNTL